MGGGGGNWMDNVFGGETDTQAAERERGEAAAEAGRRNLPEQVMRDRMLSAISDINKPKDKEAEPEKAKRRQKERNAPSKGRRGTILTSPLGIQGGEENKKSLLGE